MKRLFFPVICLFLLGVFYLPAQEAEDPGGAENAGAESSREESAAGDSEKSYIEMDIKTSSLMELAAWCRELGLSEGGAREELASRLRVHYNLAPGPPAEAGQRVITIESAAVTEYFTLDVVDEEYARLKGGVIISLKDGNAVHRIRAWEILYNRTRNVMTASGQVEYVKEEGDTVETFRGESITVNLDNWSSIFMDGVSEKSRPDNAAAYRFAGTVISRNAEGVTVLTGADITNPANGEAFWSLHASKLWLLPGNDWAILNAVLKVGNIPLLYLPFFYYPSDEIVFHPVLGYRPREGTFLQTTTYILGRPKTEAVSENSITKIFGGASENMEKKREGVFLRTTGEKNRDPNDTRLSVIFDAYVNLGVYLGTEFALPKKGYLRELNVSAGLGVTRNIYPTGNANTPFPDYDGVSEWNSGMLFSMNVPFRYRFNINGALDIKNGSLSWAFPYYSDPYVDRDFMNRSEVLDWLAMLREGAAPPDAETEDASLSSYEWTLSGSYNPRVDFLAPYLTSFSVSNFSSSLLFNKRDFRGYTGPSVPPNPERSFFFPGRLTIYSISASLAGTPFSSGGASVTGGGGEAAEQPEDDEEAASALLPGLPLSPWGNPAEENKTETPELADGYGFSPPELGRRIELPGSGGARFSVDYRLTPSAASELQFRSSEANWAEQDDIDWSEVSTILTRFRGDGNVSFNVNHAGGGAYSGYLRLSGTGSWQDYMYLNEDAEEFAGTGSTPQQTEDSKNAKLKAAHDRAYNETYFTSSWDFGANFRPFYQSSVWGDSSLQYNVRGLLAKTAVDTSGNNPDWNFVSGKWDKTDIEAHQITANLAANVMDYSQTLSLSADLPPEDASVSGNATLRAWISETSARGRVINPFDDGLRIWEPVYVTETLKFGDWGNFQQYMVFDPEKHEYTTLTSNLNLSGFTASYSVSYARPYRFNPGFGPGQNLWVLQSEESLEPREFRLGYVKTFARDKLWGNRFSFSVSVNSSLSFDLQRYTNSRFSFGLGVNMAIANFLELKLSTSSENSVIYRYFQDLPFFDSPPSGLYSGQETGFFTDLFNSFRFDNDQLRRLSGFKLKSLDLSLIHHLGDWNARLTMNLTPYRPEGSFEYKFNNEISFLIQWVPIGEIKTQIDYSKESVSIK